MVKLAPLDRTHPFSRRAQPVHFFLQSPDRCGCDRSTSSALCLPFQLKPRLILLLTEISAMKDVAVMLCRSLTLLIGS